MKSPTESKLDDERSRRARRKRLGDQLKRLYDDVANEPVPDDFLKLLEQADKPADAATPQQKAED